MGGRLLGASRWVRILATCVLAVLGADLAVVVANVGTTSPTAAAADAGAADGTGAGTVVPGTGATAPVVIIGPDGTSVQVDPSTPEGQRLIAEAAERGDRIMSVVPNADGSVALVPVSEATLADVANGDLTTLAEIPDEVVGAVQTALDDATGASGTLPADVVAQLEAAGDAPTTTLAGGASSTTAAPSPDAPVVDVTLPNVTVTLPPVTVTIPGTTITLPDVDVDTPIVSTTITIPATVTIPPTTVTLPPVTVTLPPVSVTVTLPTTTTLTIPVVTTVSSIVQAVATTAPTTAPTTTPTTVATTLPHL